MEWWFRFVQIDEVSMYGGAVTVVVVDDHSIVREGLREIIEGTGEFRVVGEAGDGFEAVEVAGLVRPDVVLMDVIMPRKDGVLACREIMDLMPDGRVVMLTASGERRAVVDALAAGATGYLQKDTNRERLIATMRAVAAGELRVPADVVSRVFADLRRDYPLDAADRVGLTQREREILVSFVQGASYAEIAAERSVKPVTVRNAIYGVRTKVGVDSMQELVVWAVRNGIVPALVPSPLG